MSLSLLNLEEQQHKDEIVSFTEQVLDAKGIECDSKIAKISEEQLGEIYWNKLGSLERKERRLKKIKVKVNDKRNKKFLCDNTKSVIAVNY
jgi:hypothetical protein